MGNQIIKQPNGLYCRFSSISDMIEIWNATPEDLIEASVRYSRETISKQVNEVIEKLNQEDGGRPYYQFTMTFEEALAETKRRAKPEHYQQVLEDTKSPIIKCPNCGNEIDPDVCYCGNTRESHNGWEGHAFVPLGCDCGRAKSDKKPTKDIKVTEFTVEESESGDIELLYVPSQSQTLYKGVQYRFVFSEKVMLQRVLKKEKI